MKDLKHPQHSKDRQILDRLLQEANRDPVPDWVLTEVARLRIRYIGFPGATDLQTDLNTLLEQWQIDEEELFARTRAIHQRGDIYDQDNFSKREDWP